MYTPESMQDLNHLDLVEIVLGLQEELVWTKENAAVYAARLARQIDLLIGELDDKA